MSHGVRISGVTDDEVRNLFVTCGALLTGHFVLTSGRHSDQYFEKFDVFRWPEHVATLGAELAQRVTDALSIPTIGIGAGNGCDAQVNVWQDLVGLTPAPRPKFVRAYSNVRTVIADAVRAWSDDVVSGEYPSTEQSYQ